jgi:hypothetical protein
MLVIPLSGMSSSPPAVVGPSSSPTVYFGPSTASQSVEPFVISNFTGNVRVSLDLASAPSGTTFSIGTTTGLTLGPNANWTNQTQTSFTGTQADSNAGLASLTVNTGSTKGAAQLRVTVQLESEVASTQYNSATGSYYEYVPDSQIAWTAARSAALAKTFGGVNGYLVNITSEQENSFVTSRIGASVRNVWIGATDETEEDAWVWKDGPEAGQQFWSGEDDGSAVSGRFNAWASGEPNDSSNEDYAVTNWNTGNGLWNDLSDSSSQIQGYVVEYSSFGDQTLTVQRAESTFDFQVDGPSLSAGNGQVVASWPNENKTISQTVVRVSGGVDRTVTLDGNRTSSVFTDLVNDEFHFFTLEVTYTDGTTKLWPASRVRPVDSAPTISGPSSVAVDQSGEVSLGSFSISDTFNCGWGEMTATVAASASDAVLSYTLSGSVTASTTGTNRAVFKGTRTALNTVLSTLSVKAVGSSNFTVTTDVVPSIRFTSGGNTYHLNRSNGHYYRVVSEAVSRMTARTSAETLSFCGSQGYLVAIDDAAEQSFIEGEALTGSGDLWTSGIAESNGSSTQWVWRPGANAGSSDGLPFYDQGDSQGSGPWHSGEPNNSGSYHQLWDKSGDGYGWDDYSGDDSNTKKYLVEFGSRTSFSVPSVLTGVTVTPDPSLTPPSSNNVVPTPQPTPTASTRPNTSPSPSPTQTPPGANPSLVPPVPLVGPVAPPAVVDVGGSAVIGGVPTEVRSQSSGDNDLTVSTGEVNLNINVPGGAGGVNNSGAAPELEVKRDKAVTLEGEGMLPGSTVQVWLPGSDTNTELGRLSVDEDGSFAGNVNFGASPDGSPLPIGPQVIQLTGVDRNGNQTVINLNVNISQPDPAPELFRGQTVTPKPGFGNFEASNAGLPEQATLTAITAEKQALVEGAGWSLSLQLSGEGSGITENADGVFMTLVRGEAATFGGNGFMPGTIASIWLFSDPTKLGEVTIAADGSFSGITGPLDAAIATGEHTIQIQGVGFDGYIRSANLGVVVTEPALAAAPFAFFDWLPLVLLGLLTAAGIFFAIVARRRKKADGSNVIQFPQAA